MNHTTPVNPSSWNDPARADLQWVSVFLRASIGSLLLSAGILKLPGGVSGTVAYYSSLFSQSLLPDLVVRAHASLILFVELAVGAWLSAAIGSRSAGRWRPLC